MLDWKSVGQELRGRLKTYTRQMDVRGAGVTLSAGDGVVSLSGLSGCKLGELIEFESGGFAILMNLEEETVGAVLLGNDAEVSVGMRWYRPGIVRPTRRKPAGPCRQPFGPAFGWRGTHPRFRNAPHRIPCPQHSGPQACFQAYGDGAYGGGCHGAHRPRPARIDYR